MPAWKRVLTSSDVTNFNLGNTNLTITAGAGRSITLGNASSSLTVFNNASTDIFNLTETTQRIGGGTNANLSISGNVITVDKTNEFIIESDDTTNAAPVLDLYKKAATPLDGHDIGIIEFNGNNSASEKTKYGSISVEINDVTDGTEDASMDFKIYDQGSFKTWLEAVNPNVNLRVIGDSLALRSNTDPNSGQGYPSILLQNTAATVDNDVVNSIAFDGQNDASQNVRYVELETKVMSVADGNEEARFDIFVKPENTIGTQRVLSVSQNGANAVDGVALTANENNLKAIQVRGVSLEQLTRRTLYNVHASSATTFASTGSFEGNLDLGQIAVTPTLGALNGAVYDYDGTHGFVVPFDSFMTSATFAYKNVSSDGVEGHAALKIYIVKADGSDSEAHTMSSASSHANNDDDFRHSVHSVQQNSQRSISVSAGDKIVPSIVLTKDSGDSDYRVTDLIADLYLYTESVGF